MSNSIIFSTVPFTLAAITAPSLWFGVMLLYTLCEHRQLPGDTIGL